jgi:hypothetical protein
MPAAAVRSAPSNLGASFWSIERMIWSNEGTKDFWSNERTKEEESGIDEAARNYRSDLDAVGGRVGFSGSG